MAKNKFTQRAILLGSASAIAVCALSLGDVARAQTSPSAKSEATTIDEIVVTPRRKALQSATELKKNSDTITDSVVADDAGKLPDTSITEVLQRVAGVSIVRFASLGDPDHFSAEGSGIQVRGLSGVAAHLNGREVFSANGGRGLLWGDVTPELMAAVTVYKDSTADLIEGGTGGAIDLRTKMPFDYKKPAIQATASGNYGDLAKKYDPSGSLLLTKTWDTNAGSFGALVDLAYSKYSSADNFFRMEPYYKQTLGGKNYYVPGGYDYGADSFERKRNGLYGALQWRPNDNWMVYTSVFVSEYDEQNIGSGEFVTSQNLSFDPATSSFDSNGGLLKGTLRTVGQDGLPNNSAINAGGNTGISKGNHTTRDWSTGFTYTPNDKVKVEGAIQFVDSSSTRKNYDVFPGVAFPSSFTVDLTGDLPQITLPSSAAATFANPANYEWQATMDHSEQNRGYMGAANIDVDYLLSDDAFFRSLKVGVRYADRTEHDNVSAYNWTALGRGWNGSPQLHFSDARAGDVETRIFDNFFRGDANLPANLLSASHAMVAKYDVVGDHTAYGGLPVAPIGFKPTDFARGQDVTTAAYAMVRFASDSGLGGVPFNGNIGFRVVRNKNSSTGFFSQNESAFLRDGIRYYMPALANATAGGSTSTKVLPALNIQFLPTSDIHLRFAYNKTLDNPSFSALKATGGTGVNTLPGPTPTPIGYLPTIREFTTGAGNPNLKPMYSDNFDFSAEWYASQSFNIHLAIFHKSIENLLIYGSSLKPVTVVYTADTRPVGQNSGATLNAVRTELASSTEVFNSSKKATISGLEIGGRKFFDELPAPFDGLGVEGNFTYIDSKNPGALAYGIGNVQTTNPTTGATVNSQPLTDNPVEGLSKYNYNLTLLYEKGKVSARIAYSWRSQYLMSTNSNGTNGTYTSYAYGSPSSANTNNKISLPLYADSYGAIDIGTSYRFNDHVSLGVDGSNLSNAIVKTLQGGYPNGQKYVRSWFVSDKRVTATLKLAF